ncbi:MAG: FtsQ-type POTRA domain-containing protein [Deltaproteobacteria bacterium]|nr:FtsQ-type POTRA domain-containing protein [Deltaproteobacteria bacterium]
MRKPIHLVFIMCLSFISIAIAFHLFSKKEPLFLLKGLKISGCRQCLENEIAAIITPYMGLNILSVNVEKMREEIMRHPYVRDVKIKRVYPFSLHIEIKEKIPCAIWVRNDGTLKVLDEEGRVFRDLVRSERSDMLLIHARSESEAKKILELVSRWISGGIIQRSFISELVDSENGLRIISSEKIEIILGKEEFENRLKKAIRIMEDAKKRGLLIRCIDARFEKGAIIRERQEG